MELLRLRNLFNMRFALLRQEDIAFRIVGGFVPVREMSEGNHHIIARIGLSDNEQRDALYQWVPQDGMPIVAFSSAQ
jgi:hypothetical protein